MNDSLYRFLFEKLAVRGGLIQLEASWQAVLERRDYPAPVRRVLGQAMAAAALLSATIKFDGTLTLQLQGQGPMRLLLVQCTAQGTLRGLARWEGEIEAEGLDALCGPNGALLIGIDPGLGKDSYQGVVGLTAGTLGAALEEYFERSEQLPTRLMLAADHRRAAGMLLQRLPGQEGNDEDWNRIQTLGVTLKEEELLGLEPARILQRLFHEEDLRLFEADPFSFRCSCSRDRIGDMLRSMGQDEVRDILQEQQQVAVECQFCGQSYHFDPVDAEQLFTGPGSSQVSRTRH